MSNVKTSMLVTFKNILFATDFSSISDLALAYAVQIARRSGATIHVVHVLPPDVYPLVPPSEWHKMANEEEEFRKLKKSELEKVLRGLPHEFLFPAGDVWQCLSEVIESRSIDLIVVGTHGRTGMQKALMGSVAERIFRQATCPVLTVGSRVSARANQAAAAELNCILYATDFNPDTFAAAGYAISLAKEYRAELILLHSVQDAEDEQQTAAFETLRDVVPLGAGLVSKPRCTLARGAPADCILDVAERDHADLIVLGVRGAEGHVTAATRFSSSIPYKIVTQAACPILTVRG